MLVLGIVGETGTGKTTVLRMLEARGAAVVEMDQIAREVAAPGSEAVREIREAFGADYVRADGSLERGALGRCVFSDEAARRRLNAIMHPRMLTRLRARLGELRSQAPAPPVVAIEAAVLAEMGALGLVDCLVRVDAPHAARRERICRRDGLPVSEADARLASQHRARLGDLDADCVIDNGGDLAQTETQVQTLWQDLTGDS